MNTIDYYTYTWDQLRRPRSAVHLLIGSIVTGTALIWLLSKVASWSNNRENDHWNEENGTETQRPPESILHNVQKDYSNFVWLWHSVEVIHSQSSAYNNSHVSLRNYLFSEIV